MKKKTHSHNVKKVPTLYPTKAKLQVTIILFIVLGFYFFSMYWTQNQMDGGFGNSLENMKIVIEKFFPPNLAIIPYIWKPLAQTIQMAIIATTIATILTVPLSLLSARNITTTKWLYLIMRIFLNIFRTIPDIVLAILFVGLFGVGVFSGILALIIFSLGILAKLMSETIEAVDMQPLEAIRATGGNLIQVVFFGLIPQIFPQFTSFVLYVFEVNVRASIVLGLVGAGGIGVVLNRELQFYNYPNAMTIIIVIFMIVIMIEFMSNRIRKALI